jgi:hypothetical protein
MGATTRVAMRAALAFAMLCRCAAAVATPAAAEPGLEYEVTEAGTGRVLFTAWGWTEATDADPDNVAVLSRTVFPQRGESLLRALFTRDRPPRCLSWERTLKDKSGAVLSTTQTRWVPEIFPLLSAPFPPDTYPLEAPMGYVVTRLGLGTQQRASFHTMLSDTLAQIDLWIDGRETVRLTAGEFDCYRVRMRANAQSLFPKLPAFLKPILSFFIPTYTVWLTVEEPQMLVQFRGQMGPPGSPEMLVRLLKVLSPGRMGD